MQRLVQSSTRARPRAVKWGAVAGLWLLIGCGTPEFFPPADPPHDVSKDGHMHAVRLEDPFSCGTADAPNAKRGVTCPTTRPVDAQLSCDASGCHGRFDFSEPAATAVRDLRGSEGPSCYTCHGAKWEHD